MALGITLVVGFGFLLMVSLILDAGLSWVGTYLEAGFSGVTVIPQILNSAIAFGIAALLLAMIFKILPAVPLTWRDVGMGAAMTALLFTAGKFVIGYYSKSGVASAYGTAASIITPCCGSTTPRLSCSSGRSSRKPTQRAEAAGDLWLRP